MYYPKQPRQCTLLKSIGASRPFRPAQSKEEHDQASRAPPAGRQHVFRQHKQEHQQHNGTFSNKQTARRPSGLCAAYQGIPCPRSPFRSGVWQFGTTRSVTCPSGIKEDNLDIEQPRKPPGTGTVQQRALQVLDDEVNRLLPLLVAAELELLQQPDDKGLQLMYEARAAQKVLWETARKKLAAELEGTYQMFTMAEMFNQRLPTIKYPYLPGVGKGASGKHPPPTLDMKVWRGIEDTMTREIDAFLARQSKDRVYMPLQESDIHANSEVGIVTQVAKAVEVVQQALRQAQEGVTWVLGASSTTTSTSKDAASQPLSQLTLLPATPTVENKGPDLELLDVYDECCLTFIKIQHPHVLNWANNRSLAELLVPGQLAQGTLKTILGQVECYCRARRARYFAITSYASTWICRVEGNKMLISEGFVFNQKGPLSVLRVLLWLSLKAGGADGMLKDYELPTGGGGANNSRVPGGTTGQAATAATAANVAQDRDSDVSQGGDSHLAQGGDSDVAQDGDLDIAQGGGSDVAQDGDSDVAQDSPGQVSILQRSEEQFTDPVVLGSGMTGDVIGLSWGGTPIAVKSTAEAELVGRLQHEVCVYTALKPLQGKFIPQLLRYGLAVDGSYKLFLSCIWGRDLLGGGRDAHLLPHAIEALRAIHNAGYLHGDIRPPNFRVVGGRKENCVMVLDFGHAVPSTSKEDMQAEEAKLTFLLTRPRYVSTALQRAVEAAQASKSLP